MLVLKLIHVSKMDPCYIWMRYMSDEQYVTVLTKAQDSWNRVVTPKARPENNSK